MTSNTYRVVRVSGQWEMASNAGLGAQFQIYHLEAHSQVAD